MDGRGTDAERARLQRAAYGRHATDADRAALAAFELREAGSGSPGGGADDPRQAADSASVASPPEAGPPPAQMTEEAPAPATGLAALRLRRFGWRVLALGVLGGLVLGLGVGSLAASLGSRSAFDVFTDQPVDEPGDSRYTAFALFAEDLAIGEALPLAGPVLLGTTEYWHVYGLLYGDAAAAGGQQVCLGIVPAEAEAEAASAQSCGARADFERMGMQVGISAPSWGGGEVQARWAPDGNVEITER